MKAPSLPEKINDDVCVLVNDCFSNDFAQFWGGHLSVPSVCLPGLMIFKIVHGTVT